MATVDVLLATYNGAKYLPDLLQSLEAQSQTGWRLLARDDLSTDATPTILEAFAARHGEQVRLLQDGRGRLGAAGNFSALMEVSDAPYFMFCDQDDVWLPDKIAALRQAMIEAEGRVGNDVPLLAHSDLTVVDEALRVMHPSFWHYSRLFDPSAPPRPTHVMLQNFVTGCAAIGNAALRRAALPIPPTARMHDWWVALVAALFGRIVEHAEATVLYRQHRGNEIGAKPGRLFRIILHIIRTHGEMVREARLGLEHSQEQAAAFVEAYRDVVDPKLLPLLREFADLRSRSFWARKSFLFRHRLWPTYWLHGVAILCLL